MRKCLTAGMFVQIAKKVGEVVKNSRSEYKSIAAFNRDMELLFANCYRYHKVGLCGTSEG